MFFTVSLLKFYDVQWEVRLEPALALGNPMTMIMILQLYPGCIPYPDAFY